MIGPDEIDKLWDAIIKLQNQLIRTNKVVLKMQEREFKNAKSNSTSEIENESRTP
jgi:hypothetical protein